MDEVHDILRRSGALELSEEVRVAQELDQGLQGTQVAVGILGGEREQELHRVIVGRAKLDRLLQGHDAHGRLQGAGLRAGVRQRDVLGDDDVGTELVDTLDDVVNVGRRDLAGVDQQLGGLPDGVLPVRGLHVKRDEALVQKIAQQCTHLDFPSRSRPAPPRLCGRAFGQVLLTFINFVLLGLLVNDFFIFCALFLLAKLLR